jgi:glycosyltransferase involved in cell wall biosynthesis
VEYIIFDGASTDETLVITEKYKSGIAKIISEKDNGIYDAMNKGLEIATGDYVLFLNAGDELFSAGTLSSVFSLLPADVYYGNTAVVNEKGAVLGDRRLKPPLHLTWKSLRFGMCVSHQSFIPRRILCEPYNLKYSISADIDWVIAVLKRANKVLNTQKYISKFLEGGISHKNRKKALMQRFDIMVKHYGLFPTVFNHAYIFLRYPLHRLFKKSMS